MDFVEAKELLVLHSYAHPNLEHPKLVGGFLGSLRPYQGIKQSNFDDVIHALIALAPHLQTSPQLDREIMYALWSICYLARGWGLTPEGMLQRNELMSPDEIRTLEYWVETISYATFALIGGSDLEDALTLYREDNNGDLAGPA